jgi:PQQ-like domain
MSNPTDVIFTGTGGYVVAIDRRNGEILWKTKVGGSAFVTVIADDDTVFAQSKGKLLALHRASGRILWKNGLKDCGYGLGCLAFPGGLTSGPPPHAQAQEDQDVTTATTATPTTATTF